MFFVLRPRVSLKETVCFWQTERKGRTEQEKNYGKCLLTICPPLGSYPSVPPVPKPVTIFSLCSTLKFTRNEEIIRKVKEYT